MKYTISVLALFAACDRPPEPTAPPPPTANNAPAAPAPASEPAPVAVTPPPPAPASKQLRVAFEGRCTGLGASVLDGEVFVHYREEYPNRRTVIGRLGADGRPAEFLPVPREDLTADTLTGIDELAGRWPHQVFMRIGTGERGGYENSYLRLADGAWQRVDPFGAAGEVHRLYPWHSNSILAVGCGDESCRDERWAVIRGAPKAPRLDGVKQALGACRHSLDAVRVLPTGPIVAVWRCDWARDLDPALADKRIAVRYTPEAPQGDVHALPGYKDLGSTTLADDGKDTVYIALTDSEHPGVMLASTPGGWREQIAPPPGGITDFVVDRNGEPWVLQWTTAWRLSKGAWVPEPIGLERMHGLLAMTTDAPIVRAETLARRDADGKWVPLAYPTSTLFADQRFTDIGAPYVDAGGDVWLSASYAVKRRSDKSPKYRFNAVLTTRPIDQPLRCGEVLGKPMKEPFAAYPTGVDGACKARLVLLQREAKWKPGETYPKLRKSLRGATDLGTPRYAELDIAGDLYVAAIVESDAAAQSLLVRARKLRAAAFPEVLCGDPAILERAGVQVVRELALAEP